MKLLKRITVTLIAVCLTVVSINAAPTQAKEKRFFPEVEHDNIPFEEMSRETTDMEEFRSVVAEIEELLDEESPDAGMLAEKLQILDEMYSNDCYVIRLLSIDMTRDASDTEAGLRYASCEKNVMQMTEELQRVGKEVLSSPSGAEVEALIGASMAKFISEEDFYTDEQVRIYEDINILITEYNSKVNEVFTVNIDGTECAWEELTILANMGYITVEEFHQYGESLSRQYSANLEEVFFRLIDKRQELARTYGYDNYYDYAYKEVFLRDASAFQYGVFRNAVKEYIAPLYQKVLNNSYKWPIVFETGSYFYAEFDIAELIASVGAYIEGLSPELGECFNYLEEMHLIDLVNDGRRLPRTYCVDIAPYKPFIMNGNQLDYEQMSHALFHEFGHAAQIYYMNGEGVIKHDIEEVHSTSLELLGIPYYEQVFGHELAEYARNRMIELNLYSTVTNCIADELEYHIYAEGVETMEEISEYHEKLLQEYGFLPDEKNHPYMYNWAGQHPHMFTNPCYDISYSVAGLAALELYAMSLEDYAAAVDTYLNFCAQGTEKGFTETLKKAGIPNILKPKNIKKLVRKLNKYEKPDARAAAFEQILDLKYYVAKPGDTLSGIAERYGTSVEMLVWINGIWDKDRIFAGDIIALPGTVHMQEASYTVQKGDTLYEIAKKFGTDLRIIVRRNNIEDITRIYAGDVLTFEY